MRVPHRQGDTNVQGELPMAVGGGKKHAEQQWRSNKGVKRREILCIPWLADPWGRGGGRFPLSENQ